MSRVRMMSAVALGLAAMPRTIAGNGPRSRSGNYPGPQVCPYCDKKLAGKVALKQHVKAKHN